MRNLKLLIFLVLVNVSYLVSSQTSQVVYSNEGKSARLDINKTDYASTEVYIWEIMIPVNKTVQVTRVNNCYLSSGDVIEIFYNGTSKILSEQSIGEYSKIFSPIDNRLIIKLTGSGIETNVENPATIRFSEIEENNNAATYFNGDVHLKSGVLRALGDDKYLNSKIAAVLGKDYSSYTCFGSINGGRIRGSNEGYLILEGNPNGYGDKNIYMNTYTSGGNVLMTSPSGRVGIGVSRPKEKLHIEGAIRGSGASGALHVKTDFGLLELGAQSKNEVNFNTPLSKFVFNKSLDVKGQIRATEIRVESIDNFPDFVFDEEYNLMPLEQIAEYIKINGHLPDMPSAKVVKDEGANLVELQIKLLQKIEELTLHIIELQKKVDDQESHIQSLFN